MMLGQDRDCRIYDVQAGQLPVDPGECTAYGITGSLAGVHDDLPRTAPLLESIRQIRGHAAASEAEPLRRGNVQARVGDPSKVLFGTLERA